MRPFTIFDNIQKYELSSDLHWTDDPNIPNTPDPIMPPFPPNGLLPPFEFPIVELPPFEREFDLPIFYLYITPTILPQQFTTSQANSLNCEKQYKQNISRVLHNNHGPLQNQCIYLRNDSEL
jgi:hypothetical protein